jgi:nicotinate-nucleotide adenylyltransferase
VSQIIRLPADINQLPENYFGVFGGTFDPIHAGHINALRLLLSHSISVLIAPSVQNPWKDRKPTPINIRRQMIRAALRHEKLPLVKSLSVSRPGVAVSTSSYVYSEELVRQLRAAGSGPFFWIVGEDLADEVKNWRNWVELGLLAVIVPVNIDVHAVQIRSGEAGLHPALEAIALTHGLYGRKPPET